MEEKLREILEQIKHVAKCKDSLDGAENVLQMLVSDLVTEKGGCRSCQQASRTYSSLACAYSYRCHGRFSGDRVNPDNIENCTAYEREQLRYKHLSN